MTKFLKASIILLVMITASLQKCSSDTLCLCFSILMAGALAGTRD